MFAESFPQHFKQSRADKFVMFVLHTVIGVNTGDRAIQVGSHYQFFEVNRMLDFDREAAMGMRLNILAGTTTRFEPGDTREVELVEYAGARRAIGFNDLVNGSVTSLVTVANAVERARRLGYKGLKTQQQGGE